MTHQEVPDEVVVGAMAKLMPRLRSGLRVISISLVFDIVLTFAVAGGTVYLHNGVVAAQKASCLSGNRAREDNRHLWDYVISSIKNAPHNPTIIKFEHYLDEATTPRNCSKP